MGSRRLPGLLLAVLILTSSVGCSTANGPDPGERVNRGIFGFNEGVDRFVLGPVAKGWDVVMPERVQWGFTNFFANLRMPVVFLNDVLQAKPVAAGQDLARFLVNTTVGIVGLIDMAGRMDIPANDEDFGQTLGAWGVGPGAYVVLPLLGPSSMRDTVGLVVDTVTTPHHYFVSRTVSWSGAAVNVVNTRARYAEEIEENRTSALDYYVFMRNAFLQNRQRRVEDAADSDSETDDDDLYEFDEGDDYEADDGS